MKQSTFSRKDFRTRVRLIQVSPQPISLKIRYMQSHALFVLAAFVGSNAGTAVPRLHVPVSADSARDRCVKSRMFLMSRLIRRTAAALLATVAFSLISCDPCTSIGLDMAVAPDGYKKAVVFLRACGGAGESWVTNVSIVPWDVNIPNSWGEIFVAGEARPIGGEITKVSVEWIGSTHLGIKFPDDAEILLQKTRVDSVQVTYEILDSSQRR